MKSDNGKAKGSGAGGNKKAESNWASVGKSAMM